MITTKNKVFSFLDFLHSLLMRNCIYLWKAYLYSLFIPSLSLRKKTKIANKTHLLLFFFIISSEIKSIFQIYSKLLSSNFYKSSCLFNLKCTRLKDRCVNLEERTTIIDCTIIVSNLVFEVVTSSTAQQLLSFSLHCSYPSIRII